jgi:Uma2 family endonuclease
MSVQPKPHYTPQEYLAREREAETKSEYFGGEIFTMAGASRAHNLIGVSVTRLIANHLEDGPCEVYANDMRVLIDATDLYTYPDITVVCEEPLFEDSTRDTLLNPLIIIEVLSDSTERYDRGRKFENYRQIPSLREYVLISQKDYHIEKFVRQGDGSWVLTEVFGADATIRLETIDCALPLKRVYAKVEFSEQETG